jgi:hypothetical protein
LILDLHQIMAEQGRTRSVAQWHYLLLECYAYAASVQ